MNSNKNKLNSKIIYNFHPNPNAHSIYYYLIILLEVQKLYFLHVNIQFINLC